MKVVKKRADMHLNSHPIIFLDLFVCVCVTFVFYRHSTIWNIKLTHCSKTAKQSADI